MVPAELVTASCKVCVASSLSWIVFAWYIQVFPVDFDNFYSPILVPSTVLITVGKFVVGSNTL